MTATTDPGRDRGPRPELTAERFANPATTDRPGMRWWWQQPVPPADLVRELGAIHAAGFGEVEIAFSPGFWADEPQREALAAVLAEAERLGIGVAATVGAAWPLQTPNTTRGTEHAAQELQYGVAYRDAADDPSTTSASHRHPGVGRDDSARSMDLGSVAVPVPKPFDDPQNARGAKLLAVTAAKVIERGEAPSMTRVQGWEGERDAIVNPERSTVLDPDSLVDLTASVVDGVVPLPASEGDWAVFGFWMRDCTQGVTSFLDRAAAVAATEYLEEHQFGAANLAAFERVGTEWFEDSLEYNADSLFWTSDLLDRFQQRHGYDVTRYLPVLFAHGMCRYWVPNTEPVADFELADGSGPRLRADYYRLITDLYIEDHLLLLQEWCARHGLAHKSQAAYGQNLEAVRSFREFARAGGRAEGESLNSGDRAPVDRNHPNWRYALDWQRSIVGGAHQGGTTRISTELGAQFAVALAQSLGDLKALLDKEWAAGITKPFVHGYASQPADAPWPTQSRFFDLVSEGWNDQHFPEWGHWRGLTDYWARGTVVLETGGTRTDVAIYRDGFLTTAARGSDELDATAPDRLADTEALERRGYSVQFIDPIGLVESVRSVAGSSVVPAGSTVVPAKAGISGPAGRHVGPLPALYPDGPAYRAVIVDERTITPDAAEALAFAAARGLGVMVVGEPPSADSGFAAGADGHARVRSAMARLLDQPSARQVATWDELPAALADTGLLPRASWVAANLLTQWRESGDRRYLLAYNTVTTATEVEISLEGSGAVRELDLWTGGFRPLSAVADGGRTQLRLALAGLEVRVLELDLAQSPGDEVVAEPDWQELAVESWELAVTTEEPGTSRRIVLAQGPADWRDVPELSRVSGVGRYTCRVGSAGYDQFRLELGELAGSATVRVGGREFGTGYNSGGVLDLGDALTVPASNGIPADAGISLGDRWVTLEIEVRTVLNNAAIDCGTRPVIEGLPLAQAVRQPLAQGLIGPVRVLGATRTRPAEG